MGNSKNVCGKITEVYSRVCGYHRPVAAWNLGKKEEFEDRVDFKVANNKISEKDLVKTLSDEVIQELDAKVCEASCA